MNFFLDENFPKIATQLLAQRGHRVFDLRGTELEGCDDHQIFECAQAKEAVFLSTDRDFFHTIPLIHPEHFGIIIVALKQPNRKSIIERLEWFLGQSGELSLYRKAILLRDANFILFDGSAQS